MSKNFYIRHGKIFNVTDKSSVDITHILPPATYTVKIDPFENFYFEKISDFELPAKLYGSIQKNADRILNTFKDRPETTGVLLSGEKGSGKTLLSKLVSKMAIDNGLITIVINTPFKGEKFNTFIQGIDQPKVIIFDEFEKVFDERGQESILTLLDGVYPSKTLYLLTTNDPWRIDKHMRNRPGRIFYMFDFKGLEKEFIIEYTKDNLINQGNAAGVLTVSSLFNDFNFDMLKALIEEMNRYEETAQESVKVLNTRPDRDNAQFNVSLFFKGEKFPINDECSTWAGSPLAKPVTIFPPYSDPRKETVNEDDEDDSFYEKAMEILAGGKTSADHIIFTNEEISNYNGEKQEFTYVKGDLTLKLCKVTPKVYNYDYLL